MRRQWWLEKIKARNRQSEGKENKWDDIKQSAKTLKKDKTKQIVKALVTNISEKLQTNESKQHGHCIEIEGKVKIHDSILQSNQNGRDVLI